MEVIGTPEINDLDEWLNTFGSVVHLMFCFTYTWQDKQYTLIAICLGLGGKTLLNSVFFLSSMSILLRHTRSNTLALCSQLLNTIQVTSTQRDSPTNWTLDNFWLIYPVTHHLPLSLPLSVSCHSFIFTWTAGLLLQWVNAARGESLQTPNCDAQSQPLDPRL